MPVVCAGEDIAAVVAWLQRGRIDREAGLLKALSAIPLVRSLPVAPVAPALPGMPQPPQPPAAQVSLPASAVLATQGQSEPLPVLSTTQLAANRPDGYTGILAPVPAFHLAFPALVLLQLLRVACLPRQCHDNARY